MKRNIHIRIYIALISIGLLIATSCSDMEKEYHESLVTYLDITVSNFTPKTGRPGASVTITGTNFGEYSEAATISFNGVIADEITSYSDTLIIVEVPEDAGTGPITVKVWTHEKVTSEDFTYIPGAKVESVDVERAQVGDTITITGKNFGTDASAVSIYIGETEAEIISISDTEIKFLVPDTESGTLLVDFDGQEVESIYLLIGDEMITGTLIGHSGSWGDNSATTITAAVDGDITTYVDAPSATGYVGYDVGSGNAAIVTAVRYVPRESHPQRMVGGEIRGANDPTLCDSVTLYTITEEPTTKVYTEVSISTTESYRYIYYYSDDGYCNIAEIEFYGNIVDAEVPEGKYTFEFEDADEDEWRINNAGDGTYEISDGKFVVSFDMTQTKRRADMYYVINNTFPYGGDSKDSWVYASDYPILAIKFTKPETVNFRPDITGMSFSNNDYKTDYVSQDVYYWDLSEKTSETRLECKTMQFKIPDITSSETGYEVDWVRTFRSVDELSEFLGN